MTDSAALARELTEQDKKVKYGLDFRPDYDVLVARLLYNFPAIIRALCVMAAVEDGLSAVGTVIADKRCLLAVTERADKLLAELGGKDGNG